MEHEPARIEARAQGKVELARRGDVAAEAFLREEAHHRACRERLGGEQNLVVGLTGGFEAGAKRARTGAQVVLGDDVGRRAVALGELDHVTAADLEAASPVDPAAEWIDVRQRLRRSHG